ncbi:hypothetical protein JJV70_16865 [Streptomyces sp. JJ66]|uniref:hypothetical protein n=1 Tax=Streptomyces sp. JJ66 TaxID=2803843 RepID=UPI001C59E105|nr:hypothetical protein [Streptomyces sp. JJ66]MBW1603749.1 hypothetical protein [Streptomyces sp. JJ66]
MLPLNEPTATPATREALTQDVDALLNPAEAEGVYRDSSECAALLLLAGAVLLAPPPPRPKKG